MLKAGEQQNGSPADISTLENWTQGNSERARGNEGCSSDEVVLLAEQLGGVSFWEEQGSTPAGRAGVAVLAKGQERTDKQPRYGGRQSGRTPRRVPPGKSRVLRTTHTRIINGLCVGTYVLDHLYIILIINQLPRGVLFKQ